MPTTAHDFVAPWHAESYSRFLMDTLPTWIDAYFPVEGVRQERIDEHTTRLLLTTRGDTYSVEGLPLPDRHGIFTVASLRDTPEGSRRVVPVIASGEDLESADIACVGEQLLAYLDSLEVEVAVASSPETFLASVNDGILSFFARSQMVDTTNGLATMTHPRRIRIEGQITGFHSSHVGRVCLIETPDGPNLGRILTLAEGATVVNGKLLPAPTSGACSLGPAGAMIPFLNHSEPARLLMGANMMRQWQRVDQAEPPLVTTGQEPTIFDPDFCPGVNLLTAFVFWGAETHEDALVISETTARRLAVQGRPVAIGDKLSHRHGTQGVVGKILPDAEMPHLPDGTPVDICYTFFGIVSRMNHGQLLEAALGWAAYHDKQPAIVVPFAGPDFATISARLQQAGLPPHGMIRLRAGRNGAVLDRESTVGYVFWGRTSHDAASKVQVTVDDTRTGQRIGIREYRLLREAGAMATLTALMVEQAQGGPGKRFTDVQAGLKAVGIAMTRSESGVGFRFMEVVPEEAVMLAVPIPHPFFPERSLTFLVPDATMQAEEEWQAVREANERLRRMLNSEAPSGLLQGGTAALRERVQVFADALLTPSVFLPDSTVRFSGRSVIAPGTELAIDEIGLPAEIAWGLFGPLLIQEGIARADAVAARNEEALSKLKARMTRTWVLVNRQPSLYNTSLLALRPVYCEGDALRLPVLLCNWLETDFDEDQLAVFLPLQDDAQRELAEKFTIAGHLKRDPSRLLAPYWGLVSGHAVLYGLAERSRTDVGRAEIAALFERPLQPGLLDRQQINALITDYRAEKGIEATLALLCRVAEYAFAATKQSGASLAPYPVADTPSLPDIRNIATWDRWGESVVARLYSLTRNGIYEDDRLGPTLLAAASGARGRVVFAAKVLASVSPGTQFGLQGERVPMPHGWRDGITPEEYIIVVMHNRRGLRRILDEQFDVSRLDASGQGVLAQATRTGWPGIVLAEAAARGEIDPLNDREIQLL